MQIATPVSHLFEDCKSAQKIIANSDCLETRERSAESTWPRQNLFHIDIDLNHEWSNERRLYLRQILEGRQSLELVTFQATCICSEPVLRDKKYFCGGYIYSREEMISNVATNIKWLRSVLDKAVRIGLENNNYFPTGAYETVTDGEFISEVVYENNILFLFDIAHAMVTAKNRNIEYEAYRNTLPLDQTIQLHLSQPDLVGELAMDSHERPGVEMFNEVNRLLDQIDTVEYLTIEYYQDVAELIESINELRKVIELSSS